MEPKRLYTSIFLEIISFGFIFNLDSVEKTIFMLLLHSIALFLILLVLSSFIPEKFRKDRKRFVFIIFTITFPTLQIGYITVFILVFYILKYQKKVEETPNKFFNVEDVLFEDIEFNSRKFGEGALINAGRSENVPRELKEKVILSISEIKNPVSMAIIKENLSSKFDEVRLYAFSVISKMEKELNEKIHSIKKKLKDENLKDEEKVKLYYSLASVYYDLVYFNIVDEEFKNLMIEEALHYAKKSLDIQENPDAILIIAKIYMRKGMLKEASEEFEKLFKFKNISPLKYIPYLAEVYYKFGLYKEVKNLFRTVPELEVVINPNIHFVIKLWKKNHGSINR
ncbi:MAG: tetratricopeptide repeat protein [Hydrogenothermaceae bacterium]